LVGDAPLVAHNAGFDIAFIGAELKRAARPPKLASLRRAHQSGERISEWSNKNQERIVGDLKEQAAIPNAGMRYTGNWEQRARVVVLIRKPEKSSRNCQRNIAD
jgi:hypothetical protein